MNCVLVGSKSDQTKCTVENVGMNGICQLGSRHKLILGFTPKEDLEYIISTWTQFENDCGESRALGGVHFRDTIANTYSFAHAAGDSAVEFVRQHLGQKSE